MLDKHLKCRSEAYAAYEIALQKFNETYILFRNKE